MWDYVKRPNLCLISVPECDRAKESKLENTFQDIIQENFSNLESQANIQVQEIQRTPQRYSSRGATPRHIIIRFTSTEMKEKNAKSSQRERSVHPQRKAHQTHSRSQQKPYKPEESGGQYSTSLKKRTFNPESHIQPN